MATQNLELTARAILENLVFSDIRISSPEQGVQELGDYIQDLEVIHIYIENINPCHFRKKKYFNIRKVEIISRLDEWVYGNLMTNAEYAELLDRYRPLKERIGFDDVDEYILDRHYRPKAIKTLFVINRQGQKEILGEGQIPSGRAEFVLI